MSFLGRLFGKKQPSGGEPPPPIPPEGPTGAPSPSLSPGASDNRRIRVFVSSTFRDMMEERDALMTHAWPELRRFCRERQVELTEVDLRWGIAEEQSTRRETLKLCLDEIHACRPFFVGLLGERYGWVPGDDAFTADLEEEQPWLKDLHGKSVTELEILHGVINNSVMAGRSFFYFRDPTCAQSRGADFLSENPASADKQAALKNLIRTTAAAKQISLREDYPNPRSLAAFVLADLQAAIDSQFPKESIPDPLTREARDHEAFAEIRRRTYIGRPDYYEVLDRHVAGDGSPLVLLGDSGSGKSALLANWVVRWREAHPKDVIFQHYIGGTADSAEHWRLMTRLIAEVKRWTDDPEDLPRSHDDLLKTFPVWLVKARIKAERDGVRFIIVLDALNQLEDRDHARFLGWLPSHPFTGPLRLIVSTLPADTLKAVEERGWGTLHVLPLTLDERRRMIEHYLARFVKKLDKPRLERLAAAPAAANPLYLKILLDELRVTGTHDRLDERLGEYLTAPDIRALLRQVLARYQRDYERDRPGLVGEALGLIWAARRGLTESEILRLLRPPDLPQLPLATWAPLSAALAEGLVDRGGILNFAYDFLRDAVEDASAPHEDKRDEYRLRLVADFEGQPISARSCDELPWLLWQAQERDRLRACLINIDRFLLVYDRDKEELMRYWVWLGEERTMGKPYLISFDAWSFGHKTEEIDVARAANRLALFFGFVAALHEEAERLARRALAIYEKNRGPNDPDVALTLNNLARLVQATYRYAEAETLYKRALAILEINPAQQPGTIAVLLNNLASLLQATSRLQEAESLMRRVLAMEEETYGSEHPAVGRDCNNLGQLLEVLNRPSEAESLLRRALAIDENNFGLDHPSVAIPLNNLSRLLLNGFRIQEAEPLMRRALAIDETSYGPSHPKVALDLNNLGKLLQATNRLSQAEGLIRRALAIDDKNYVYVNSLAQLLQATNRPAEAETLMRRSLGIAENSCGIHHPNVGTCLLWLATLLLDSNRCSEAEPLMRRALTISERVYEPDHPEVAIGLYNLGMLLQVTKRFLEAESYLRRALKMFERSLGLKHPTTIQATYAIAILSGDKGDNESAANLLHQVLEVTSSLIQGGRASPNIIRVIAGSHGNLAYWGYAPEKNWEKAEFHYLKSIELFKNLDLPIEATNVELNLLIMFHQTGRGIDVARARALTKTLEDAGDKRAEKGQRLLEELSQL